MLLRTHEQGGLDFCLARDPLSLPSPLNKYISYILSTGVAQGVTRIIFDFCKREKKKEEAGIRTFRVNTFLDLESFAPIVWSWGLSLVPDNCALSLYRDSTCRVCIDQGILLKFTCKEELCHTVRKTFHLLSFICI